MHTLRTTTQIIAALASFLVLIIAQSAFAEPLTVDSWSVDRMEFHLNTATDAINRGNLAKAKNHINWALGLLPDQAPILLFTFQINAPFQWSTAQGPMPITINALAGWSLPQILFTGRLGITMAAYGELVALYDQNMALLSNNQTTNFLNGTWQGYAVLRTSTGQMQDLGLHAFDAVSGVAGNSNAIRWTP